MLYVEIATLFVLIIVNGLLAMSELAIVSARPARLKTMIDRNIRDLMVSEQHWIAEGDGPDLVVMCVPPTTQAAAPPSSPPNNPPPDDPPPMPPGYGYGP